MAETTVMSAETILARVRERKEVLERTTLELESARQAVEQMGSDLFALRGEVEHKNQSIAEKDEAIEDLLAQNQELQESLGKYQAECENLRAIADEKDRLVEELNALLG